MCLGHLLATLWLTLLLFLPRSDGPSLDNLRIMAICGDVQVPLSIESQEGHVGTVSFTPTMAGEEWGWS